LLLGAQYPLSPLQQHLLLAFGVIWITHRLLALAKALGDDIRASGCEELVPNRVLRRATSCEVESRARIALGLFEAPLPKKGLAAQRHRFESFRCRQVRGGQELIRNP